MTTGIHHPAVAEKRISFDLDPATTTDVLSATVDNSADYLRIATWDHGTTEGGSSGSALFNQNGRIVGQLYGGYAACGNTDSDWYGRVSSSWEGGGTSSTRLKDWLDPDNAGTTGIDGINQDDALSIDDVTITEGNSGTSQASFTVTLNRISSEVVTVDWATQDDTATTANSDYVANGGSLTFTAIQTSKNVVVTINGDTTQEPHETFRVVLSNAVNASIARSTGLGTITNDDFSSPPVITSPTTVDGIQNQLFTYQIEADNTPTSFALGESFPGGMTIDGNGLISWTPTSSGPFTADIEATNPAGTDTETLTINVAVNNLETALDTNLSLSSPAPIPSTGSCRVTIPTTGSTQQKADRSRTTNRLHLRWRLPDPTACDSFGKWIPRRTTISSGFISTGVSSTKSPVTWIGRPRWSPFQAELIP